MEFKVGDEVSYTTWGIGHRSPENGMIVAIHDEMAWVDSGGLLPISVLKEPYIPTDKAIFVGKAIKDLSLSSDYVWVLEQLFDAGCRFVEVWHGQLENIPTEGTWLLKRGEKVFDTSEVQTETEGL